MDEQHQGWATVFRNGTLIVKEVAQLHQLAIPSIRPSDADLGW